MSTPRKRTPRKKTPAKPVEPSPAVPAPQPATQDSQPAPKQPVNFNWLSWVIVAVLAGLLVYSRFIPKDGGAEKPAVQKPSKVFADCQKADKASKVRILRELSGKEFASDQLKLEWLNKSIDEARAKDYKSFGDLIGDAVFDGKTKELADALEAGR